VTPRASGPPDATGASTSVDQRSLATALTSNLRDVCEDRLGEISWFKADWQRGGAATGMSTYRQDDGHAMPVVLKLPVVGRELVWLRRLQDESDPDPVVPRLFASGEAIGGYDLAWLVMERFEHGPLGLRWHDDHVARVAEAAARFQAGAAKFAVDRPAADGAWEAMLEESTASVRVNKIAHSRRWLAALKATRSRLEEIVRPWSERDVAWVHGDLHLANAMSRHSIDKGPVSLIDLAEVRAGHWTEDAVYLERQLWARPERLKRHKPIRLVAAARRRLGLPVDAGDTRLATIRRVLLAASAPKFIRSEGHPKHLEACLSWLERGLGEIK